MVVMFAALGLVAACGGGPEADPEPEAETEPEVEVEVEDPTDGEDDDVDSSIYCLGPKHDHEHDPEPEPDPDPGSPGSTSPRTQRLMAACELMFEDGMAATVASTPEAASEHTIRSSRTAYEVEIPANEKVYLTVEVTKAHTNTRFYIKPGSGLSALHDLEADIVVLAFNRGLASTQCPEMFDMVHLWHVHAAGTFVLEFEAGEARTARFLMEGTDSDHSEPPGEGEGEDEQGG